MCHGIPQTRLIPLLPGLTAATLPLNSRRCTTQVASYHPPCFLGPYGYRAKVAPRSTRITPCVWLFLFVPGRIGFMWRFCTCTFQGSVNPWFYFFPSFLRRIVFLALWSGRPHMDYCIPWTRVQHHVTSTVFFAPETNRYFMEPRGKRWIHILI